MKITPLLLTGASVIALASAAPALAQDIQDDSDTVTLDTIVVQGTEDPTGPVAGYAAGTSASTKSSESLLETPSSVTVITTDQINDTGATNLSEAVNYAAGTVTETYGADPRYDSVIVRGADLQNELYLNGLRYQRDTDPDYGAPSMDLYGMERVELLRGPESVLYGSGSSAGLLNLIQKRAQLNADTHELGFSTDSNGSAHVFGDFNKVVSDRLAYRITAKTGDAKTPVEEYGNPGGYLGIATKWQATDKTQIQFLGSYQKDNPSSPTGVPNDFIGVYSGKDLRDFYFGNEALEYGDRRNASIGYELTHDFDNGWKLVNNTRLNKFDWDYSNLSVGTVTGTSVGRTQLVQDENTSSIATDLRLQGEAETGAVKHAMTFGLDARRFKEDTTSTFYYGQTAIDYADPDYSSLTSNRSGAVYTSNKDVTETQYGLYARDFMTYNRWRADVGLRHDWNRSSGASTTAYTVGGSTTYTDTDLTRNDSATTGQASIGYMITPELNGYLSYATSFQSYAAPDSAGNVLKPTTGKQWEAGLKFQPANSDSFFTAAIYDLREHNRSTSTTDPVTSSVVYNQVGKSHIYGLELEGRANYADGWSLTGGYSFTHSEIIGGDNDGNQLANTPEQTAKLWLSKQIQGGKLQGLTVGGGVRYIGSRYAFNANDYQMDSVTLLDAGMSYPWHGATVSLNVTNLTDKVYVASEGYYSTYFGDGRTISAKLTYDW